MNVTESNKNKHKPQGPLTVPGEPQRAHKGIGNYSPTQSTLAGRQEHG